MQTHWNITHAGTPSIAEFGYAEELTPAGLKLNDPTLKRGEAYLDMRDMLLRDAKLGTIAI